MHLRLLFAYVVLLIVGFAACRESTEPFRKPHKVAVITHELTKKVRKTLEGLYRNLVDVTEVMPPFLKKSKASSCTTHLESITWLFRARRTSESENASAIRPWAALGA